MEKNLDLTHLLNEETDANSDVMLKLYELDPEWNYAFNVNDSGLSLTLSQG